jgi:hypothetical protein
LQTKFPYLYSLPLKKLRHYANGTAMKYAPVEVYLLCLFHLCIGISAFAGGASLMLAPDGSLLGLKIELLKHSPFANYFIPGLVLFLLMGIFPSIILFGLLFKPEWKIFDVFNIYKDRHGAWAYSLYCGIIVLAWVIFQQVMVTYFWLQPLVAVAGLLIIVLTLMPVVMRYYLK